MKRSEAAAKLNCVLELVYRSLPTYIQSAPLYVPPGMEHARDVLQHIAADHKAFAERLAEAIHERGARPETGNFPLDYTSYHDASIVYVLKEVRRRLEDDARRMECCIEQLAEAPLSQSLAKEILARTREHVKMLEEPTQQQHVPT